MLENIGSKSKIAGFSLVFLLLLSFFFKSSNKQRVVNVYCWSQNIDETIFEDFEKETGIKVNFDVYDTNEILESKVMSGNIEYDIIFPTFCPFFFSMVENGKILGFDPEELPELKNYDKRVLKLVSNGKSDNGTINGKIYGVPYLYGITGIAYNTDIMTKVFGKDFPRGDLSIFFDLEKSKKITAYGLSMMDSYIEVMPFALLHLGYEINTSNKKEIDEALNLVLKVRPGISKFSTESHRNDIASLNFAVAETWSGDFWVAKQTAIKNRENSGLDSNVPLEFHIPKQGAIIWSDVMCIPANSKNIEEAKLFFKFMMRPDICARNTNAVGQPNANRESFKYVDKELLNDPVIFCLDKLDPSVKIHVDVLHPTKLRSYISYNVNRVINGLSIKTDYLADKD